MKLSKIFNRKNILSFIEGNYKYYYNKMVGLAPHIQEQTMWRLMQCKNDCVLEGECIYCGCDPQKKVFVEESCNDGERFPDLMGVREWEEYKKEHNIVIDG